jgi:16S rRNA (cytosine967-C5)-methyltransferase
MPVSPARLVAFEILLRVEREESYASELLHSPRLAGLSSADHGLATELVMGVLRWRSALDDQIGAASTQKVSRLDPEVLAALRLGAYQLLFLSKVPARAAIFESVELTKIAKKRSAAPFVNAVLRKVAKAERRDFVGEIQQSADVRTLTLNSAHPDWLVARWAESYGFEAARQICVSNQTVPLTAIHVDDREVESEIAGQKIRIAPGRLVASARRILSGDITATRAHRERRLSIQDEASQLIALLVGNGVSILDCCAAPGGKTALIAGRNPQAKVVASDLHAHRALLLRRLVCRPNVRVIVADARHFPLQGGFDRVLADVPCSGTGTLARHPEIKWRLKPEDINDLHARQIAILRSALAQLKPGGRLVYSTCSLEREENEAVLEAALSGKSEFAFVDCRSELERLQKSGELAWKDLDSLLSGPYLRTIPGMHPCDGFFAAILERRGH